MHAAHDSKETVSNTREINLTGEEVLNKERGEDPSSAGRAVRTIAVMIKDTRTQSQSHSTRATFVQARMKQAGDTSTPRPTQLWDVLGGTASAQALCPPAAALCSLGQPALLSQGLAGPAHTAGPEEQTPRSISVSPQGAHESLTSSETSSETRRERETYCKVK